MTTHEVAEYGEQQDVCTQQTLSSSAKAVGEQDLEERFVIHCQESQNDIGSSYYHWINTMINVSRLKDFIIVS